MRGQFILKPFGMFEQEVTVTEVVTSDVVIAEGDEVIVQVRAKVKSVLSTEDGIEVELDHVQPHKIVQVMRARRETKKR